MIPSRQNYYDLETVEAIARRMNTAIDAASLGIGDWDAVNQTLADAFPGTWTALQAMNFKEKKLSFARSYNLERHFLETYQRHFAAINPMNDFWSTAPSGVALMSEQVAPWRSFRGTEFYNDWLKPQGDVEGSGGIKVNGDRGESINLTIRYPLSRPYKYERAIHEVLQRTAGSLSRSIELAGMMRRQVASAASIAALVQRSDNAAFVLTEDRRLMDANSLAEQMLSAGNPVTIKAARVTVTPSDADQKLEKILSGSLNNGLNQDGRILFKHREVLWQLIATPLPCEADQFHPLTLILQPCRLFLVQVNRILPRSPTQRLELDGLSSLFDLTAAEGALCRLLLSGKTVNQAADEIGVSLGTARNRLKSIMHKTGTSRQPELMLLLDRLR